MANDATLSQIQAVADHGGVQGATKFIVYSLHERQPPGWKELEKQWSTIALLIKRKAEGTKVPGDWLLFLSRIESFPVFPGRGNFWAWRSGLLVPYVERLYEKWRAGGKLQVMFEQEYEGGDGDD